METLTFDIGERLGPGKFVYFSVWNAYRPVPVTKTDFYGMFIGDQQIPIEGGTRQYRFRIEKDPSTAGTLQRKVIIRRLGDT